MDVSRLSIFLVVAEELHFGRAADRLHMVQPHVSRTVASLERALGARLFERSTRRVALTPAGEQLVGAARRVLDAVDEMHDLVRAAEAGDRGQVDIMFAGVSTHGLIGELSRGLRRAHPGITPNFHSHTFAEDALNPVLQGQADLALGRWDFLPPAVESSVITREELMLAVPVSHALAGRESVSMRELAGESFIELAAQKSVLHDRLVRMSHAAGFEPSVVQKAPDTWIALTLVAAEVGVTLTLDTVRANVQDRNVRFIPVSTPSAPIELRMAWMPENANPALSRTLAVAADAWGLSPAVPPAIDARS